MISKSRVVVLNFGANVIVNRELCSAAVNRVRDALSRGEAPIVVCSPAATPAGGEIQWTGRFVDAMSAAGIRSVGLTRRQIGVQPGDPSSTPDTVLIDELLEQGIVPVVTGAMPYGARAQGERQGSDVAAIVLGNALKAASVIVYTTVDGVMSADPERVEGATPINYVSYVELMELADRGGSVVSPAAAELARTHSIRYEVRGLQTDRGTAVREDALVERSRPVTAVTASSELALVSVRIPKGSALHWEHKRDELLERFAQHDISIEMLQWIPGGARFVCEERSIKAATAQIERLGLHSKAVRNCTRLVLVGSGLRSTSGVFYSLLRALTKGDIQVLHFADSHVTISVIVSDRDAAKAETVIHDELIVARPSARTDLALHFEAITGRVEVRGRTYRLGERQAQLLAYLLDNGGKVIESDELSRALFGEVTRDNVSALRVHVHNLRKKIEADPDQPRHIITIPNRGYIFMR